MRHGTGLPRISTRDGHRVPADTRREQSAVAVSPVGFLLDSRECRCYSLSKSLSTLLQVTGRGESYPRVTGKSKKKAQPDMRSGRGPAPDSSVSLRSGPWHSILCGVRTHAPAGRRTGVCNDPPSLGGVVCREDHATFLLRSSRSFGRSGGRQRWEGFLLSWHEGCSYARGIAETERPLTRERRHVKVLEIRGFAVGNGDGRMPVHSHVNTA